jgi:hypothetical protein
LLQKRRNDGAGSTADIGHKRCRRSVKHARDLLGDLPRATRHGASKRRSFIRIFLIMRQEFSAERRHGLALPVSNRVDQTSPGKPKPRARIRDRDIPERARPIGYEFLAEPRQSVGTVERRGQKAVARRRAKQPAQGIRIASGCFGELVMAERTVDETIREAELGQSPDDLAHQAAADEAQHPFCIWIVCDAQRPVVLPARRSGNNAAVAARGYGRLLPVIGDPLRVKTSHVQSPW